MKNNILTTEHFYQTCTNLGINSTINNHIWIGFSGGLDSRVLLELSNLAFGNNTNYQLHAVHINHGINKHADLWQEHCRQVCDTLKIKFHVIKINVDYKQINDFGLEAALRNARNKAWQGLVAPEDYLLLAHHLNDQAETVLLRLLRGTGLTGLKAIQAQTIINKVKIIRPLLNFTRQELETFVQQHNLSYITDDSNYDQKFARNFLRLEIIPKLITNWPKCINNIGRTALNLQQAEQFIKKQANCALLTCYKNPNIKNILVISKLLEHDPYLQTEILRAFLTNQGFNPPDQVKLNKIYTEIIAAKIDGQPKLNLQQYAIYRYRDKLYTYSTEYLTAQQEKQKQLSFKVTLDNLEIYFGDTIDQVGIGKAKKIFQALDIPPWQRKEYPLVFQQGKLIAIIGLWVKK